MRGAPRRLDSRIRKTVVILVDSPLPLLNELSRRVILGRMLDHLASQIDRDLGLGPAHIPHPSRRDEHVMTTPPVARVYDQVANRPRVIVDEQIFHVADLAVVRFDMMTN